MFTGEIQRARSKRPLFIFLGFIALVGVLVLLVPMPRTVKSTFVLLPASTVELVAPRDGVIAELVSASGSTVGKGSIIAKYDVADAEKQVPELEKKLAALEQFKAAGGKPTPKAKAALTKAEGALKASEAALEKATKAAKGKTTPAVTAAQKKHDAAQAALDTARAAVGPAPEQLEPELTAAQAALTSLKAEIAAAVVLAPGSGVLTLEGLDKGATLKAGARLGVVDDVSKLRAQVKVPAGEPIKKGQGVELVFPTSRKHVLFGGEAKGDVAEGEIDNANGEFKAGTTGEADIEGEQRSVIGL